jgi:hypothetical protein
MRHTHIAAIVALLGALAPAAGHITSARAQSPMQAPRTTVAVSGNNVEPLSNGFLLTMTLHDVKARFGAPIQDDTFWGGGVKYRNFSVIYDAAGNDIWPFTITGPGIRLHAGLNPGSSMQAVKAIFPGGIMVYGQYKVTYGQYLLHVSFDRGRVSEIDIAPAFDHAC